MRYWKSSYPDKCSSSGYPRWTKSASLSCESLTASWMNLEDTLFSQKWLISTPRKGCKIFKCCGFLIYRDCLMTLRTQSSFDLSFGQRIFNRSGRSYSRQRLGVTPSAEAMFCWIAMHVLKYSSKANTVSALCDWMNSLIAILDSSYLKCPLVAWSNTALNFFRISSLSRVC